MATIVAATIKGECERASKRGENTNGTCLALLWIRSTYSFGSYSLWAALFSHCVRFECECVCAALQCKCKRVLSIFKLIFFMFDFLCSFAPSPFCPFALSHSHTLLQSFSLCYRICVGINVYAWCASTHTPLCAYYDNKDKIQTHTKTIPYHAIVFHSQREREKNLC